ncbi:hypothetical protein GCM10027418_25080 [Mariniluteicoccus endophyticus]
MALAGVATGRLTPFQAVLVVTVGQVVKVFLPWMGKPDLYLLAFLLAAALWYDRAWSLVPVILAALSHPSVTLIAAYAMVLGMMTFHGPRGQGMETGRRGAARWIPPLWVPLGATIGWLANRALVSAWYPGLDDRAARLEAYGWWLLLGVALNAIPFVVVALAPAVPLTMGRARTVRGAPSAAGVLRALPLTTALVVIVLVSLFVVLDHSRVLGLLAFPLLVRAIIWATPDMLRALRERPVPFVLSVLLVMAMPQLTNLGWVGMRFEPWQHQLEVWFPHHD